MQAGLRAPLPDGGRKANPHAQAREAVREYVRGPTCDRSKAAGKKQQRTAASKPRGRESKESGWNTGSAGAFLHTVMP